MSFSQRTSSGYATSFSDEGRWEGRRERTPTSHGSWYRHCLECGCYLEAISREIKDLQDDNKHLNELIMKESEVAKQERYCCIDLKQMLDKTKRNYKAEVHHLRAELFHLQEELVTADEENKYLQHNLQMRERDIDTLLQKLTISQGKVERYIEITGLVQEQSNRLQQQLSDSEKQKERIERTMLTYKSLVLDISDEAEQLHERAQQLQSSHDELSKTTFSAFCKVRPTLLDLHKVILKHIPNNRKNTRRWLEFLTALGMRHEDIPSLALSEGDARWNVYNVLEAWLNSSGLQPKTWGTLLSAMCESGTPFLRELANAVKEDYLRKLASLHLPFDVCCVCWKNCSLTTAP